MNLSLLVCLAVLGILTAIEIIQHPDPATPLPQIESRSNLVSATPDNATTTSTGVLRSRQAGGDLWENAVCRGQKLLLGCTLNAEQASQFVTPITSPWQGNLFQELQTWGYDDDSGIDPDSCNFVDDDNLYRALSALGIDPRSYREQGSNVCFSLKHQNGPAVELLPNKEMPPPEKQTYVVNNIRYRVTGARFIIGINAVSGVVYFLDLASPEFAAKQLWGVEHPPKNQLPALRSSSDIAWGLWFRQSSGNLRNIQKFISAGIFNEETVAIIKLALQALKVPPGQKPLTRVPSWPGLSFSSGDETYAALLGSPNGLGVGYFLIQHKEHFGGNKYVSKITVFGSDIYSYLNLLFWVEDAPTPPPPPEIPHGAGAMVPANISSPRVVKISARGHNIVREHAFHAKL